MPTGGDLTAHAIAVDATNVYWTNPLGSSVQYRSKTSGPIITLATNQSSPYWLVLVNGVLTWTALTTISGSTYGNIYSIPVGGGATTTVVSLQKLVGGISNPITADQQYVYWLNQFNNLFKTTVNGTTTVQIGTVSYPGVAGMASSGTKFWWTLGGNGGDSILKVPTAGGSPATEASGQAQPFGIAYNGGNLVWVNNANQSGWNGSIMILNTATSVPTLLASNEHAPTQVAFDGTRVVFNIENPSYLRQVPASGGSVVTLAATGGVTANIVMDAQYAYWTTPARHLYKVALQP